VRSPRPPPHPPDPTSTPQHAGHQPRTRQADPSRPTTPRRLFPQDPTVCLAATPTPAPPVPTPHTCKAY